MSDWNPRYVAYADAHGNTPEAQLLVDREQWPGGVMTGFTIWISRAWQDWRREHGYGRWDPTTDEDQADFDRFIAGRPACLDAIKEDTDGR